MAQRYRLTRIDASNGPRSDKESNRQLSEHENRRQRPYMGQGMSGGWYGTQQPYDPHRQGGVHDPYNVDNQYAAAQHARMASKPRYGWIWTLVGMAAVVLIVVAAVWMSGVSGSLHHLNQTAQQNASSLARQSAQLTGIQARLQQISQQLSLISQQISTFFGNIMQAISSGKL